MPTTSPGLPTPREEAVHDTIERIAAAERRRPGGIIAFDADGTLWSGDVGDDLFFALVDRAEILPPADTQLRRLGAAYSLDTAGPPGPLARRIFEAFQAGVVHEEHLCAMLTWVFAGWERGAVRAFAREVLGEGDIASRVQPEVAPVLAWARRQKLPCYVVSASARPVVELAVEAIGLDPTLVVATSAREAGGVLCAEVEKPMPYGPGKVQALRARTSRHVLAAFGDNVFDLDLLREAEVPVAVRPKPRLCRRAHELPAMVFLCAEPLDRPFALGESSRHPCP
ncbi:MAG TPA: HAD family hydrolase [Polyangiaceae bacterium]|jgi:phosphoserine phosphatase